uniref:Uncharacterized protein n=1 Tax=virus sp. ctDYl1 TaxID=2826795 RepID=A0A8S5R9X4_9VIRU|nr:MAG TPA: hypothetical protein [virus sp. ctDYl1]
MQKVYIMLSRTVANGLEVGVNCNIRFICD